MLGLGLGLTSDNTPLSEFSLTDITGLKAWYKFKTDIDLSGSNVTTWNDSSGNTSEDMDLDASGTVVYDSGSGAVIFSDANNSILETAADQLNLGVFTIFGVVDIVEAGATNEAVIGRAGNDEFRMYRGASSTGARLRANANNYDINLTNPFPSDKFLFTLQRQADDTTILRIDGTQEGSVAATITDLFDFKRIGNGSTDSSVYEIAVYDKALSAEQITTIEADINSRVGV